MRSPVNVSHLAVALTTLAAAGPAAAAPEQPPSAERVSAIAAMLPERPVGLGQPITNRAAWERIGREPAGGAILARAEQLLGQPMPEQPDDLFLEFSRNGNRTRWQNVAGKRRSRLPAFVLAECIENKGRFLPAIEEIVRALCAERTWVMPAHDGDLANFSGKSIDIDLASSAVGWEMATAAYLLGEKLSPPTRQLIRDEVRRRVLAPYRAMFTGARAGNWWMFTTNNWNAVCLAGVTGTALAASESRQERAEFIAAAEKYSRNFLKGFTPDGYCSEGLGYWNYGFGHYVLLAETVRRATGGGLDLLALPEAYAPATFAARIQVQNGVAPAFADCGVRARPDDSTMWYLNRRFALGLKEYETLGPKTGTGSLFEAGILLFPETLPQPGKDAGTPMGPEMRSWFKDAGILIARPAAESACRLAVALKGGHNAEHHNHNDVGSYLVVLGERPVLLDPGAETYTARTFSAKRYDSKLLNSFGHPVPVVAGTLQRPGHDAAAKVLRADFGDKVDTLEMDLTTPYPVPELKSLRRTFVYSREGGGSLTVTDHVEMKSPRSFGTAILTLGGWRRLEDGALMVWDVEEALRVEIDTGGIPYTVKAEEIHEDAPVTPTRLGIDLDQPVEKATVTLRIRPLAEPAGTGANLLRNGDFELGTWGWDLSRNSLGSLSTEQAASGKSSLKIADPDAKSGSNVYSARTPVKGNADLELRGKVFHASGQGIGMYVHFLDEGGKMLNPTDDKGNIAPVGSLSGAAGKWVPFSYRFKTPPGTTAIRLWIHSFNGSQVEAYLDDLEVVRGM